MIIWSSGNLVIWSIWLSGHLVIWSICHLVIWTSGHLVVSNIVKDCTTLLKHLNNLRLLWIMLWGLNRAERLPCFNLVHVDILFTAILTLCQFNCHCLGPTIKVAWGSKSEGQIWSFCAVPGWQCVGRSGEKRMFSSKNHEFRLTFEQFEDSLVSMCNDVKRLRAQIGGDWVVTFGLPTRCHFSVKPFIHDPCSTLSSSLSVPMWNINWSTNQDSHRRAREIVIKELAASIVMLERFWHSGMKDF